MTPGRALGLVSLTAVLANSTWFSATAIVPALNRAWGLGGSGAAWLVAVVISGVPAGPGAPAVPPPRLGAAARALRRGSLRLVTLGYMGHMWELYALWAWLPAFYVAARGGTAGRLETGLVAFAAIGLAGLAGALTAGRAADRVGRTVITSAAMIVSAGCCLISPLAFGAPAGVLCAVLLVWGAAVIADSAQFSAAVTELAEPRYAGSALTLQLAFGFALTVGSIRLVPVAADAIGWRFALLPLAIGPLAGTLAMLRLRVTPERVG